MLHRRWLGILAISFILAAIGAPLFANTAKAQVIAVPAGDEGSAPTQTMLWESPDAIATLIFIPGGIGQLGLKPTQTDTKNNFYQSLKLLTHGTSSSKGISVVLFDSPAALDLNPRGYPWSRASKEHLKRISSVVRFYKQRTEKPIWLMGHSNGAVSVTELVRFDDPERGPALLSGLVVSGARTGTHFDAKPLGIPVLFLHHANDQCRDALPSSSVKNFEQVKQANKAPTEFRFIKGGEAEARSPCQSGYHMYNGAETEMVEALRSFISANTR